MQNILITGANGLIGRRLSEDLQQSGYHVRWLIRKKDPRFTFPQFLWDPARGEIDCDAFDQLDAIIQLAGHPIASGLWTSSRKKQIVDSRLNSIQTLLKCLTHKKLHIPHIVQASATGFYGDQPGKILTEDSANPPKGFLSEDCHKWEAEALSLQSVCNKLTIVRTGLFLDHRGGIWPKLLLTKPIHFLSYPTPGLQMLSWIHYQDYQNAMRFVLEKGLVGPVNFTAPESNSVKNMIETVARLEKLSVIPGPPSWLLRLFLGEMSSLILDSQQVIPQKLLQAGFLFNYPNAQTAASDLIKSK